MFIDTLIATEYTYNVEIDIPIPEGEFISYDSLKSIEICIR